jgi:hypothetical protein
LKPDGNALFIDGQQNLQIDPGYAAGEVEIRVNDFPGAGVLNLDANSHNFRAYGGAFTNPPTQIQLDYTTGINFNADISGTRRDLFTVDLDGNLQVGFNLNFGSPSLGVDGLTGNTIVGGTLTINNGIAVAPGPNSYAFPNNRGINGYVLVTNSDGTTQWKSPSALVGYWTESPSTLDLYPTAAGQNVFIRNAASVNKIELFATGYIVAYGGNVNQPTFSVANNGTGIYGTNTEVDFAVNGLQVAKLDQNYFYSYG